MTQLYFDQIGEVAHIRYAVRDQEDDYQIGHVWRKKIIYEASLDDIEGRWTSDSLVDLVCAMEQSKDLGSFVDTAYSAHGDSMKSPALRGLEEDQ